MTAHESPTVRYEAIGVVRSPFTELDGMPLQSVAAEDVCGQIEVRPEFRQALKDLDGFSHVWVVSHLHRSEPTTESVVLPFLDVERGLFATRSPRHPNPIGLSVVRLLGIEGSTLRVSGLDLLDGTPVLDLKPYVPLFDGVDAERIGWLTHRADQVHSIRADRRFDQQQMPTLLRRPSVRDVMDTNPKTQPHDATVGEIRTLFEHQSVRLALLVNEGVCTGTINRAAIPADARDDDAAATFAQAPRTIDADASLADAHHQLGETEDRRLLVLDDQGRLQGLVCHKGSRSGFCSNKSSCDHRGEAAKKTRWHFVRWSESGAGDEQPGLLVAPEGKAISVGDLLTLPPETRVRWLVLGVDDAPGDAEGGIATVEAFESV
jgi:tRNA-Thr(GGU) m(6)t(6)A37 methyltransferase TsaA